MESDCMLLDLPNELLFRVFCLLDSNSLENMWLLNNSILCNILQSASFWHLRLHRHRNSSYVYGAQGDGAVLGGGEDESQNWFPLGMIRLRSQEVWSDPDNNVVRRTLCHGVGSVDSLHFLPHGHSGLLAAGSRDRCLAIYRPSDFSSDSTTDILCSALCRDMDSLHAGWIWSVRGSEHCPQLLTACWDCQLNLLDYGESGLVSVSRYKCGSPALCCRWLSIHTAAVTCYGRSVRLVDWREPSTTRGVSLPSVHRGAVFSLAVLDDMHLISGSEDRSLVVWDLRNRSSICQLQMDSQYALTLISCEDVVWAGDRSGGIHLLYWKHDAQELHHETTFTDLGHTRPITGLHADKTLLIASSENGKISMNLMERPLTPVKYGGSSVVELPSVEEEENLKILALAFSRAGFSLNEARRQQKSAPPQKIKAPLYSII